MVKVVFTIQDEKGEISEKDVTNKFMHFNDALFEQAVKAYRSINRKLLKVTLTQREKIKNPEWIKHQEIYNENAGGYNPHTQYVTTDRMMEKTWTLAK